MTSRAHGRLVAHSALAPARRSIPPMLRPACPCLHYNSHYPRCKPPQQPPQQPPLLLLLLLLATLPSRATLLTCVPLALGPQVNTGASKRGWATRRQTRVRRTKRRGTTGTRKKHLSRGLLCGRAIARSHALASLRLAALICWVASGNGKGQVGSMDSPCIAVLAQGLNDPSPLTSSRLHVPASCLLRSVVLA